MFRIIYIFFIVSLIACSDNDTKPVTLPLKPALKQEVEIEKATPKDTLINNENVVERLTAYGDKNPETIAEIYTTKGKIKIRLYKDTPLHRANFIMLAKKGYYDGCLFSRVLPNFIAQCGGSYDEVQQEIMKKIGYYSIPAEMKHSRFHKKGAIAAARSYIKNPDKRSEPDEFYFVEGTPFSDLMLDKYTADNNYNYTTTQRNYYLNNRGAAHLDGEHTVFGIIISGFSVIPKLTDVETDSRDWPYSDLYIDSVRVIK